MLVEGNAVMTLKSKDPVKVLTVRATNFAPAADEGGNAKTETLPAGDFASKVSSFVSQELTKSDRPALTAAKVIISGGMFCLFTSINQHSIPTLFEV